MTDFVRACAIHNNADVLTTAFSADSTMLCAGTGDSTIEQFFAHRLFSPSSVMLNSSMTAGEDLKAPVVCIRFLPPGIVHHREAGSDEKGAKNLMLAACVDGGLSQWHLSSGRRIQSAMYAENPIFAVDYSPCGEKVAGGCNDGTVKLLDTNRLSHVITHLKPEIETTWMPNGSQRIQSLKHIDANLIVSGGWSRTALVWDIRSGRPVTRIVGPYICGDGVDAAGDLVVTASYREEEALQLWDLRNVATPVMRSLEVPPVPPPAELQKTPSASFLRKGSYHHHPSSPKKDARTQEQNEAPLPSEEEEEAEEIKRPKLFTAKFCPDGSRLLAGGNFGQLHFYNVKKGIEITPEDLHHSKGIDSAMLSTENHSIFSISWSPDGRSVGIGGGHGLCLGVTV